MARFDPIPAAPICAPTACRLARALLVAGLLLIGATPALGGWGEDGSAPALRARYATLREALAHSPFGQPLHLESQQSSDHLQGDIHAVLDQPFDRVRSGLADVRHWCDLLILHPNVTGCRASAKSGGTSGAVDMALGRSGAPVAFTFRVLAAGADYLRVALAAPDGPLGTTDYRVDVEATPLDPQHTIVHLAFSQRYGLQARIAMSAYLATFGRGKVGFTVVDRTADGRPVYVDDFRGALERNAMRYYVCVDAYLQSLAAPPSQRLEKQLRAWHAYTERYPLQLHEAADYVDVKRALARSLEARGGTMESRTGT